ncbi:MAG: D-alanyl-D-alanine carboxypeptidase/D-alanyl-D-alanine-endopeptidase [Myxococcales bacterium]|nr:D-alanyl-D-alanine carboxypeptidase/D-alanyl-D-alanine-endopeptidase [Myxococcales bacterium]
MRRWVLAAIAVGLALPASAVLPSPLEQRLDAALAARVLRGARVAGLVVGREDGRVLYARSPDRGLVPASNLKILTAIAALSAFGPSHRFRTELFAGAPPDADGAIDVLSIRGSDPALTSEEIWRLAADLRRLGVRRIRGGLRLDDSGFDGERWHPSWGRVSARAYHAPVGALSVNYGAFAVEVGAGEEPGDPVRVILDPPLPFLRLVNRARTGRARARSSLRVEPAASNGFEDVVVSGVVPAGREAKTYYRSVRNPARYAGAVIRYQLEANGIEVAGETITGPVPDAVTLLLSFEGKSLGEIVRLFVKFSNNAIAESLVKAMGARATGAPGTWKSGVAAMLAELASLGLDVEPLTLVDGSGLSYANRVPPRSFVEALRIADRSFRFGPELVAALPIAASDGTLEERAEGAADRVRAKTGLLTRVTALSGFAQRADGGEVVFCVMVNGYRGSDEEAMEALDRFVSELVAGP